MLLSANHRNETIDIAKGIGMILVVFAHVNTTEPLLTIIYSFHMPLFFVLAGSVMNVDKYQSIRELLAKKFKSLIIPYYMFCFFGILSVVVVNLIRYIFLGVECDNAAGYLVKAMYSVIWAPYSLKYFTTFNTPMWFVPCLLLVEVLYYMICKLFKTKWTILLSALIISTLGWVMESDIISFDFTILPFNFSSACFAIGFFILGNIAFPYLINFLNREPVKHSGGVLNY